MFWAVYICEETDKFEIGTVLQNCIVQKPSDTTLLNFAHKVIGLACLLIPISWTITASVNDVRYDYYYGKAVANFLMSNHLDQLNILGSWHEEGAGVPFSEGNESYVNTAMIGAAVPINAYFDHNVFFNLNHNDKTKGFIYHRRPSFSESQRDLEEWRSYGAPEVIVGKPRLNLIYKGKLDYKQYKLVFVSRTKFVWKNYLISEKLPVFLRSDLIEVYKLAPLEGIEYSGINGIEFTEEMKERYEKGEAIEDILEPYLDEIFGDDEKFY